MTTYLSADTHFGHANIIKYCSRPFDTAFAMDNALICNFEDKVSNNDELYLLGDISFPKKNAARDMHSLPGKKQLIIGNHDDVRYCNSVQCHNYLWLPVFGDRRVLLIHDPEDIEKWNIRPMDLAMVAFCGHVHEKWVTQQIGNWYCINVGVDVSMYNYCPVSIDELDILYGLRERFNKYT